MAFKTAAELFGDGGAWGIQVPIDVGPPSGVYDPTNRGIGFGEALTSAIANRSHYALGLNDDDLNTRLALWETGGLNAAYDLGAAAVPGGGRLITKDAGAIETTSTLGTQYLEDLANAHFRANALSDTTSGGGFDFRGNTTSAYGFLSRQNAAIAGAYTTLAASAAVLLNPGGAVGSTVRYAAGVSTGGNTDLCFLGLDFIEINGSSGFDGLYILYSLGATPGTDLIVRTLSGSVPAFTANTAATARIFRANVMSSTSSASFVDSGLVVAAGFGHSSTLTLLSQIEDSTGGVVGGGDIALGFWYKPPDGNPVAKTFFTAMGRMVSEAGAGLFGADSRAMERLEGGIPVITLDKSAESGGRHEIGVLVQDTSGLVDSWAAIETRNRIDVAAVGIDQSLNGVFSAVMGTITLTDTGPTPPGDLLKTTWSFGVQPGMTLVRLLTGTGAGRIYLLYALNLTAGGSDDQIVLRHLDGSALDALELPVDLSVLTFQFVQRQMVGGRIPPIALDGVPAGFTSLGAPPTDITPSSFWGPANDTAGDSSGLIAAAVRGDLYGVNPIYPADVATVPHVGAQAKAGWVLQQNGNFFSKKNITADESMVCNDLTMLGASAIPCQSVDIPINQHMLDGYPEETSGGIGEWWWDQTNGVWVCRTDGASLYFPLWGISGATVMSSDVQIFFSVAAAHEITLALQKVAPDWAVAANAPTYTAYPPAVQPNNTNVWVNKNCAYNVGAGQAITPGFSWAFKVTAAKAGDMVRALRHTVRFTQIGPGLGG